MPVRSIPRPALLALLPVVLGTLACWGPTAPPPIQPDPDGPVTITRPGTPAQRAPVAQPSRPGRSNTGPTTSVRPSTRPTSPGARPPNTDRHATPVTSLPASPGTAEPIPPDREPSAAPSGTAEAIRIDRATLERELAGVESVGEVIGLRPHITWRGIDGITVHDLPSDSPLAGVGLQQGDVVHSVNGRSLTSIDAAWSLGEVLQTADVLEGEITRDGTRQRIVVHLD